MDRLGSALEELLPVLQRYLGPISTGNQRASVLMQVDQSLSLTYKAIQRFRNDSSNLYGLSTETQLCLSEPWSSRPRLLELLRLAFVSTEEIVTERTRELGSGVNEEETIQYGAAREMTTSSAAGREEKILQRDFKNYMTELADYALAMHQERMAYLQRQVSRVEYWASF